MNIKLHIGEQIVTRRKALGLSQEDLAHHLDLNRVSIHNIEAGKHGTTAETMYLICHALQCTPNDLYPPIKHKKQKFRWVEKTIKVDKKIRVKKLVL